MLIQLRRLHAQVREAIARNAEAAGRLLQATAPPEMVAVPTNGRVRAVRPTSDLTLYHWNGKRWERRVLADGEE